MGITLYPPQTPSETSDTYIDNGGTSKQSVVNPTAEDLIIQQVDLLKKIEYHLSISTDTDLEHTNL